MAMVMVVYCQPTSGLMAQAKWLSPKVGIHLALCCTDCMNQVNSCTALCMLRAPQRLLLLLLLT